MSTKDEVEMIISVNGESTKIPPGFRFHPTEEELLLYYLTKKIAYQEIDLDVIRDIDLNKLEPWDIQEKCKIGSGPQNDWYLLSHKDKKYPTGTRTNRATSSGFWKATGRDKVIRSSFRRIGMRKTLVFYKGRAPHGRKSDWIMHEYRLELDDVHTSHHHANVNNLTGDSGSEEGGVVCRVFKKKDNHQKATLETTSQCSSSKQQLRPTSNAKLDQILQNRGKFRRMDHKYETKNVTGNNFPSNDTITQAFHSNNFNIPRLDHVSAVRSPLENSIFGIEAYNVEQAKVHDTITSDENDIRLNDWVALEQLLASQLNGQHNDIPSHFSFYDIDLQDDVSFAQIDNVSDLSNLHSSKSNFQEDSQVYNNNLWSYNTQSPPLVPPSSNALSDLSI